MDTYIGIIWVCSPKGTFRYLEQVPATIGTLADMPRPMMPGGSTRELLRDAPGETNRGYVYTSLPKDSVRAGEELYSQRTGFSSTGGEDYQGELSSGTSPSMVEYNEIVKKATVIQDISADCWGALFFVVVNDMPDLKVGRISASGKSRIVFSIVVFCINLFIQFMLLYFICKLLMMPGMLSAQNVYQYFTSHAFTDRVIDHDLFELLPHKYKAKVCGLALSQTIFARVVLFLWITTNVGELRGNYVKMASTINLPQLPQGLDLRLMVKDSSDPSDEHGGRVVCLNQGSKELLVAFIFVPKFIICIFLTTTGCLWLLSAENIGDLILNSLALAFVVQVDELIATVFFPATYLEDLTRLGLASQKEVEDPEIVEAKLIKSFFLCTITLLVTAAFVELAIRFQPVIPSYNGHEVSEACLSYISSQVPWCMPGRTDCFPENG